jgi:hypothetical protein
VNSDLDDRDASTLRLGLIRAQRRSVLLSLGNRLFNKPLPKKER